MHLPRTKEQIQKFDIFAVTITTFIITNIIPTHRTYIKKTLLNTRMYEFYHALTNNQKNVHTVKPLKCFAMTYSAKVQISTVGIWCQHSTQNYTHELYIVEITGDTRQFNVVI